MLTIIIPSYNEPRVNEVAWICQDLYPTARIIIGNDFHGHGKGYAVRKGLEINKRFIPRKTFDEIIVIIDGDMDINPSMIARLIPFLDEYDIVVGSKPIGGMPISRKLITLCSRIFIKALFWLDVDTQTGIKAFRSRALPEWENDKFMFDVEILVKAKKRGAKILEIPIRATSTKSKSMGVLWRALKDILRIWYRLLFQSDAEK